jgi:hypothetical protein
MVLEILQSRICIGNPAKGNYAALLSRMGCSPAEVKAQLNAVARPFGIHFGSGNES